MLYGLVIHRNRRGCEQGYLLPHGAGRVLASPPLKTPSWLAGPSSPPRKARHTKWLQPMRRVWRLRLGVVTDEGAVVVDVYAEVEDEETEGEDKE